MSDKDYSLLRPFDLKAAKRGEAICYSHLMSVVEFVGEATAMGCIATKEEDGRIAITPRSQFRLAPLCWVEGKPVYKGDRLWRKYRTRASEWVVADRLVRNSGGDFIHFEGGGSEWADNRDGDLSWTQPKVKREGWVNVYPDNESMVGMDREVGGPYATKQEADEGAALGRRIDCVRIEWEEQP